MNELQLAAARTRGAQIRTRADRPTQRRSAEEPDSPRAVVCRNARPEIRQAAGSSTLAFTGLACATGAPYEMYDFWGPYIEVVDPGAFLASLARSDLDVPLVLQHVDLRRIARTTIAAGAVGHLALAEDDEGLRADAPDLDPADPDVDYIARKIRSGLIGEMSFKFRITKGSWSPDWMEYHIQEADIHRGDVAICGYGANPNTTAEIRDADLPQLLARASDADARRALESLTARFGGPPVAARTFHVLDSDLV